MYSFVHNKVRNTSEIDVLREILVMTKSRLGFRKNRESGREHTILRGLCCLG